MSETRARQHTLDRLQPLVAESITITDNRTGESSRSRSSTAASTPRDWRKLLPGDLVLRPGLHRPPPPPPSAITDLDGEAGILRYRGYPIEQLAEHSTYLEVAYLLIHGELPTAEQYEAWMHDITYHTFIHENVRKRFMEGFHHDAHPMGMLVSAIAALSTFYPEAKDIDDPETRYKQIVRLIAKMPTLAAGAHRFSVGMPFVYPDNTLDFAANFLSMMWKVAEPRYEADPVAGQGPRRAVHPPRRPRAELRHHRHARRRQRPRRPVLGTAAAAAALYGPRHGGANEAGHPDAHRDRLDRQRRRRSSPSVKAGKGKLQGFGHRVYKNYDPRAKIIKKTADEVFEVTGKNPLLDIALKLEEVALADDYFISRKLYPNVDFYSGLIYQAMGFPIEMFTVLFAIPRTVGLAGPLGRAARAGPEDRPAPPALQRRRRARLRRHGRPLSR